MAVQVFELFGEVFLRDRGVQEGLEQIEESAEDAQETVGDSMQGIEKTFKTIGKRIIALGIGKKIFDFGKNALMAASDVAEMESKFDTVFGELSKETNAWADNFRDRVGGSVNEIKTMLAASQDMLTGFGATRSEAMDLSERMQELGTDLASFGNIAGGAEEAVERLRKGLLGEHENLKALGIVINETAIKQEAARMGYKKSYKELTELEKINIRYSIAVKQSQNAIGDAEKTSGSFANQLRDLQGRFKDLTANVGKEIIPVIHDFVDTLIKNMPTIKSVITTTFKVINPILNVFLKILGLVIENIHLLIPALSAVAGIIIGLKIVDAIDKITGLVGGFNVETLKTVGIVLAVVAAATALLAIITALSGKTADVERTFKAIGKSVTGTMDNVQAPGVMNLPRYANGTTNHPGGLALVGEQGPEIVNMPARSQVYTNTESKDLLLNKGINMYGNIIIDAKSVKDFNDVVEVFNNLEATDRMGVSD